MIYYLTTQHYDNPNDGAVNYIWGALYSPGTLFIYDFDILYLYANQPLGGRTFSVLTSDSQTYIKGKRCKGQIDWDLYLRGC